MAHHYMKVGDRKPDLVVMLKNGSGGPLDLTNSTGVVFRMSTSPSASAAVTGSATVTSAAAGEVTYSWAAGDTDAAGSFLGEFEITWAGGTTQTVPAKGYISILIQDDLA